MASLSSTNGTVGGQGLAALHAHRGGRLGIVQLEAGADARGLVDLLVGGEDRLLLLLGQARPRLRIPRRRGGALMDQQHVLHRFLLLGEWSPRRQTGSPEIDSCASIRPCTRRRGPGSPAGAPRSQLRGRRHAPAAHPHARAAADRRAGCGAPDRHVPAGAGHGHRGRAPDRRARSTGSSSAARSTSAPRPTRCGSATSGAPAGQRHPPAGRGAGGHRARARGPGRRPEPGGRRLPPHAARHLHARYGEEWGERSWTPGRSTPASRPSGCSRSTCRSSRGQRAAAARSFGATCFLRLMIPGRLTRPSAAGASNARSSVPRSPEVSSSVPLVTMSVIISASTK